MGSSESEAPIEVRTRYLDVLKRSLMGWDSPQRSVLHLPWDLGYVRSHDLQIGDNGELSNPEIFGDTEHPWTSSQLGVLNFLQAALDALAAADVHGDVVEAGVFNGHASLFVRAALDSVGNERVVWLLDSFRGVPPPRPTSLSRSPHDPTHAWPAYTYAASEASVRRLFAERFGFALGPGSGVEFLPGLFNETLRPGASHGIERVALLRVDVDTYEGTLDVLHGLYDAVPAGGFIVVDDFHLDGCRQATLEFREQRGVTSPLLPIPLDYLYSCPLRGRRRKELASLDVLEARFAARSPEGSTMGRADEPARTAKVLLSHPPQSVYWVV